MPKDEPLIVECNRCHTDFLWEESGDCMTIDPVILSILILCPKCRKATERGAPETDTSEDWKHE